MDKKIILSIIEWLFVLLVITAIMTVIFGYYSTTSKTMKTFFIISVVFLGLEALASLILIGLYWKLEFVK